ncbi:MULTISPECIES: DUF6233 domain-containing protein [unclassified Streptomyces]|uniref:DUF6233 domain-containing protein n=1 Tax=unclassified Streptomyces TaxID=2593676 RepID=UPI00093962E8|nr:DUF6233 domain-containing protein [Streptomyces sp. TSRI0281]OKI35065.1 hypothetical protein A6A29_16745 [Streptomyces sp. TSRI0281]
MSETIARLEALLFLRRFQEQQLDKTDRWIAAERRRVAEKEQGERAKPPLPDYVVEVGIGSGAKPVMIHAGHCYMLPDRHRAITREQAMAALTEHADRVPPCTHCRPDTELGIP